MLKKSLLKTCNQIFISRSFDPHFNVAFDKYLSKSLNEQTFKKKKIMFLSSNHNTVSIGEKQNHKTLHNSDLMRQDNVSLIRRFNGGPAHYLDSSYRSFNIMYRDEWTAYLNEKDKVIKVLNMSLNRLNICHDIEINTKYDYYIPALGKVIINRDQVLFNFTRFDNNVSGSVPIANSNSALTHLPKSLMAIDHAFITAFDDIFGVDKADVIYIDDKTQVDVEFYEIMAKLKSDSWTYGKIDNDFIGSNVTRFINTFEFGTYEIYFKCDTDGTILKCGIYSDDLDHEFVSMAETAFIEKIFALGKLKLIPTDMFKLSDSLGTFVLVRWDHRFETICKWLINELVKREHNNFTTGC